LRKDLGGTPKGARCTYEHLARQQTQLSDLREQETVRIALKSPQTYFRSSMKMAAGRRGWKPRQALSQVSTRVGSRVRGIGAKLHPNTLGDGLATQKCEPGLAGFSGAELTDGG